MNKKKLPLSIEEIHNKLFAALLEIEKLLNDGNVSYYLMFGTLLGCIREQQMIKWDDDVDICVRVEDWERMNQILTSQIDKEKYSVFNYMTKPEYPYNTYITRVVVNGTHRMSDFKDTNNESGIFVDIYQLTNIPESRVLKMLWEYELGVFDGVINMYALKDGEYKTPYLISKIIYFFSSRFDVGIKKWLKLRYFVQVKHCKKDTECVTVPFGPFGVYALKKTTYKKQWFESCEYKRFSNSNDNKDLLCSDYFPVPNGYKEILTVTYGDWERKPCGRRIPKLSFWDEND
ncbi:MAG: LicD family protein [Oribacterium sp.]|nr:LicD family protein [Oribacterium sp.]